MKITITIANEAGEQIGFATSNTVEMAVQELYRFERNQEKEKRTFMECSVCHKVGRDVYERPNAYANDIGNNPDAVHTVCDSCDHENRMDI